jgi:NADH-quinone oxidoreductase subunit L
VGFSLWPDGVQFRVVILTFFGEHPDPHRYEGIHESPKVMTIPLLVFAALSLFIFYSPNPVGAADGWFLHAVERPPSVVPESVRAPEAEQFEEALHHAHVPAMALSLAVAGLGILAAFATYRWKKISAEAVAQRFPVRSSSSTVVL